MTDISNHAQRVPDRSFEVSTTKLVRLSQNEKVVKLSKEQLDNLKASVHLHPIAAEGEQRK